MNALAVPVAMPALTEVDLGVASMGGWMRLRVACAPHERDRAERDLRQVARRVGRWAARLTRFEPSSELCALNADPDAVETSVGPTLAAVLAWGTEAGRQTQGVVDVTLLDERLATEQGVTLPGPRLAACWASTRTADGRHGRVLRDGEVRFDLDGVAKGWIADRALALLGRYPAALVDADGDIAVAMGARTHWTIGVVDPDAPGGDLVSIALDRIGPRFLGVATSGIDVHRWGEGRDRHHLIDPATGRPAVSDVAQCTVVADSAALAEVIAKAVVIRGSGPGTELLERSGVLGGVLLLRSGEVLVTDQAVTWLA